MSLARLPRDGEKVFSKAHNAMKHIKNFIVISFLKEIVVNSYYVAGRTQKIACFMRENPVSNKNKAKHFQLQAEIRFKNSFAILKKNLLREMHRFMNDVKQQQLSARQRKCFILREVGYADVLILI